MEARGYVLVLLASLIGGIQAAGCEVKLKTGEGVPVNLPLMLAPKGSLNLNGFLHPDKNGKLNIAEGKQVELVCSGANNYFDKLKGATKLKEVTATCSGTDKYLVNGVEYKLSLLKCAAQPSSETKTGGTCYNNGVKVDIGFQISRGFIKLMEVCFNNGALGPVYTMSTIVTSIIGGQKGRGDEMFHPAGFYGTINPDTLYERVEQEKTLLHFLSDKEKVKTYLTDSKGLSVGHLAANSDFEYRAQKSATFYYINTAPQWRYLNNGKWSSMETDVVKLASAIDCDLDVYTGTHGLDTVPGLNNKMTPLYLSTSNKLPVPQFFWKVVYCKKRDAAVTFVGVNSPTVALANRPELKICKNICSNIKWLTWKNDDKMGVVYCCELAELRKVVPSVPNIPATKLLT